MHYHGEHGDRCSHPDTGEGRCQATATPTFLTRLFMTIGLAVVLAACPAATATKTQVTVGSTQLPDMSFTDFVAGTTAAKTVTITGSHFVGTNLEYKASSGDENVATAEAAGNVVTVTPKGAGTATVLVTASATESDEEGRASQSFTVTVTAPPDPDPEPPPDNNAPRLKAGKTLPHHTDLLFGGSEVVDLSEYFTDDEGDAIMYDADSTDEAVVTTSVSGSMLTITVVNHGDATIRVTATDAHNESTREAFDVTVINQAPMIEPDEPTRFGPYMPGDTQKITVSEYFTDVEGDSLMYGADSSDDAIVTVTDPDADSVSTITAVAVGTAMITITANDGNSMTSHTLTVTVSAVPNVAPEVTGDGIPNQSLEMDFMAMKTLDDLSMYFSDSDSGPSALTYTPSSSDEAVATATVDGSTLTIAAVAAGSAMITVTASDGADQAMDTFTVTVTNPAVPTWKKEIPDVTFEHDGAPQTFTLAAYFNRATMYEATSDAPTVVEADVNDEQTMLTLTRVGAGSAVVEVTPSNSGGNGPTQSITVTVTAAPAPSDNMLPRYKEGKTLADMYPIQLISGGDPVNTADDAPTSAAELGDAADNMNINLDTYFEDPDGVDSRMTYKVTKTADNPKDTTATPALVVLDIHSTPAFWDTNVDTPVGKSASGDPPDGEDESERTLVIEPRNLGSATITVEVRDEDGDTATFTFTIEVVASTANAAPTVVTGASIQGQTGDDPTAAATRVLNKRLEIGDERKVIDSSKSILAADTITPLNKFSDYFGDVNFDNQETTHNPNERLELTWKFYPAGTEAGTDGAVPTAKELAADKVAVTVSVSPTVWRGGVNERFSLTLTGEKGTTNNTGTEADNGHMVALIATDSFGKSVAVLFRVEVNNPPVAYGPTAATKEKDRKTPGGITKFNNLHGAGGQETYDLDTTVGAPGDATYSPAVFSDADGDALTCQFRTSEHNVETPKKLALVTMNTETDGTLSTTVDNILEVDPAGTRLGNMTVMVKCKDTFDKFSSEESIPVRVTEGLSIHS